LPHLEKFCQQNYHFELKFLRQIPLKANFLICDRSKATMKVYQKTTLYLGLRRQSWQIISSTTDAINFVKIQLQDTQGFTIQHGTGYWKGADEGTILVTMLTESKLGYHTLKKLAENYKAMFDQETVLLETTQVQVQFI
jgi:hypothetical protein